MHDFLDFRTAADLPANARLVIPGASGRGQNALALALKERPDVEAQGNAY